MYSVNTTMVYDRPSPVDGSSIQHTITVYYFINIRWIQQSTLCITSTGSSNTNCIDNPLFVMTNQGLSTYDSKWCIWPLQSLALQFYWICIFT